jgi:hypothetical protein
MRLQLDTLIAATLALATLVVVSTALAAVTPERPAEPAAISCPA